MSPQRIDRGGRPGPEEDSPLPEAVELEMGVLGRLMRKGDEFFQPARALKPWHFSSEKHREIFRVVLALHRAGDPFDELSVVTHLKHTGMLKKAGGAAYVSRVEMKACPLGSLDYAVKKIREAAGLRRLARLGDHLRRTALSPGSDRGEMLRRCRAISDYASELSGLADRNNQPPTSWRADQLLAMSFAEPAWVVQGEGRLLLPESGIGTLFGWGGVGKSLLAMELGLSIASGRKWLGAFETTQAPVLFVDFEGVPWAHLKERLRWLCEVLGIDPQGLPFHLLSMQSLTLNTESSRDLRREIRKVKARLTIVDSATTALGWDELNPQDITRTFRDVLYPLRDSGTDLQVIDHSRKPSSDGSQKGGDSQHDLRGSTAKLNAVDYAIGIASRATPDGEILTFTCAKARFGPRWRPFAVRAEPASPTGRKTSFLGDAEPRTSPAPKTDAIKDAIREILEGRRDLSQRDLMVALEGRGHSERTAEGAIAKMVEAGELKRSPHPSDGRTYLVWLADPGEAP